MAQNRLLRQGGEGFLKEAGDVLHLIFSPPPEKACDPQDRRPALNTQLTLGSLKRQAGKSFAMKTFAIYS